MTRRSGRSYQFTIDAPDLSAALQRDIIEAIIPKEIRKQAQTRIALEKLADVYPTLSTFPPSEREKIYSQLIFPAYGVYQPPLFRRLFGAKPESILPLPSGAEEIPKSLEGMKMVTPVKGRRRELQAGITLPPTAPIKILPSPLLQPEHEEELRRMARAAGMTDPEEVSEFLLDRMVKGGRSTAQMTAWMINRAERWMKNYKEQNPGVSDEQAFEALKGARPGLATEYELYKMDKETANLLKTLRIKGLMDKPPVFSTEKKVIDGVRMERKVQWDPESKTLKPVPGAEWVPIDKPEKEKEEKEDDALAKLEKKWEKERNQQLSVAREELKRVTGAIDRGYANYLTLLKRMVTEFNKTPQGRRSPIVDVTEHPKYLTQADWLLLTPEGRALNKRRHQIEGKIHYYLTGRIVESPPEPQEPKSQSTIITFSQEGQKLKEKKIPKIGETPKSPIPQYNERGERISR